MSTASVQKSRKGFPWTEWNYEKNTGLLPASVSDGSNLKVWWFCDKAHEFQGIISDRVRRKSKCPYCVNKKVLKGFNDLVTVHPEIAHQWHPSKNGSLKPSEVVFGSGKRFWWICDNGHEWEAQLHARVVNKSGCRVCAGQAPEVGKNDLATTEPFLASQWNHSRNSLKPTEVMRYSGKKVWWTCPRGHEFEAAVNNRSQGSGCPICSGRKLLQGFNDLATLNPELAKEWHPTRNKKRPSEVRAADKTPRWWMCSASHEFRSSRNYGKGNCPYCTNRILKQGTNDLAAAYPELVGWWDSDENGSEANEILHSTRERYFWKCPAKGHPFKQSIYERHVGAGCPVCVGKHVVSGVNDLVSQNPVLASQWDYQRNILDPTTITPKSHKRVWWSCPLGHSWEAIVKNRNMGNGCPFCANMRLLEGFNDLATVAPHLVSQWDLGANGGIEPSEVCIGSDNSFHWRCDRNHTWKSKIRDRIKGAGCRICVGQAVDVGVNDLLTTHPELAAEWHLKKNLPLTPRDVMAGTGIKLWWQCPQGHEWKTTGNTRLTYGTGCPSCARYGFDPSKEALLYFIKHKEYSSNKVGITGVSQNRLRKFEQDGWVIVQTWRDEGGLIAEVETGFFNWLRKEREIPQYLGLEEMKRTGGFSETFGEYALTDAEIIRKIREIFDTL